MHCITHAADINKKGLGSELVSKKKVFLNYCKSGIKVNILTKDRKLKKNIPRKKRKRSFY